MTTPENATQRIVDLYCRLSYLYAYTPQENTNDNGELVKTYHVDGIMDPADARCAKSIEDLKRAQREVAAAAWNAAGPSVLADLANKDRLCLKDGNGKLNKHTNMPEESYAGKFYVSANGRKRPTIVVTRGGANVHVGPEDPCAPYSGCWGIVRVAVYPQLGTGKTAKYGRRINAQFMGVQFIKHDAAFGGGRVAKPEEFGLNPIDADGEVPMDAPAAGGSGLY